MHNKNGTSDGYTFYPDDYSAGKCGKGHNLLATDIPQGNIIYDTATANMGSQWKMPTYTQCHELIDNTTSEWITINGINGRKFINKSDSTKYIFLGAGGMWQNSYHVNAGVFGIYWSTTCYMLTSNQSYQFYFNSNSATTDSSYRYCGKSIRPIKY